MTRAINTVTPGNATGTDTPGLIANALGNPALRPEKSAEFESGFESRLFNVVNVDFTYYNKKTHDALIAQPIAGSAAPSATSVTRNLGSVQNSGLEATVSARLLDRRAFGWDVTLAGSHNTNKVLSLGVDATGKANPTIGTGTTRDSVGLPANAWFFLPYTFADSNHDGIISPSEVKVGSNVAYMGYSQPRDIFSVSNGFDLLNRKLRLNVLVDYKGGFSVFNTTVEFYCSNQPTCYEETNSSAPLWRQARNIAQRYEPITTQAGYLENGQFWRLREVSASLSMPNALAAKLRARDASLVFSGRNLHLWSKYTDVDPEQNYTTGDVQTDFETIAPPTYFIVRLNLHSNADRIEDYLMLRLLRSAESALVTGATTLVLLAATACNARDELLAPQQPGVISPGNVQSPIAAEGLYEGAVGQFKQGLLGGNGNQETIWQFTGLFTDEYRSSDTFSQRNDADQRVTQTQDAVLFPLYNTLQQTRGYAHTALLALQQFEPTTSNTHQAEMYFAIAFAEIQLGEDFCNGVPLSYTVGGIPQYTDPMTDSAVFALAAAQADSGLALATGTDAATAQVRNALTITKGRAQLDVGQTAAAGATVASVPASFQYAGNYSQTTNDNGWWIMTTSNTHQAEMYFAIAFAE
ncbi:MAG TPA: TonB-dependent receptor, partial [Gemmatimonadaceae bacterium]